MGKGPTGDEGGDRAGAKAAYAIELDDLAKGDLREAILAYEIERQGLGERFELAVHEVLGRIAGNPYQYQAVSRRHRRAAMAVFPYAIYYYVHRPTRRVLVLSVHHAKRHPKHWRRRKPQWRH